MLVRGAGSGSQTRGVFHALHEFLPIEEIVALIERAKHEDLGAANRDVTSELFVPAGLTGNAAVVARKPGRISGTALLPHITNAFDPSVGVRLHRGCGKNVEPGDAVATFTGSLRSILAIERTALNFLTHLSGIATLTAQYVAQCSGTRARVFDTRKTLPGLRGLQKYAVACGDGGTHRVGLHDAVLIKDNHLAHVPIDRLASKLSEVVGVAREAQPALKFVEVEVDTLEQLRVVLTTGIDIVLLDNMSLGELREAVAVRDQHAPNVELEASGGVNLDTVGAIARTGVDRISVGALTHSAPSLDLGLDIA